MLCGNRDLRNKYERTSIASLLRRKYCFFSCGQSRENFSGDTLINQMRWNDFWVDRPFQPHRNPLVSAVPLWQTENTLQMALTLG